MDWILEHWSLVAFVLTTVASILAGRGWLKTSAVLTAVVKGVEGADNKQVKQSIQSHATVAGVEEVLKGIVKKVTEGKA